MSFRVVYQQDFMDCGPACLAMVCKHFGKNVPLARVREKTQIGKQGVNILGISEAAEEYGFRTLAVQLTYQQLISEASFPCILHWSQAHFVVLTRVKKKTLFGKEEQLQVADPADGLMTLDRKAFENAWISSKVEGQPAGVALLLEPTPAFYQQEEEHTPRSNALGFRAIFGYLAKYRRLVGQLLFSLLIATFFQMLPPFLTQSIVDKGIQTNNLHFIYVILLAQAALFGGRIMVDFIRSWILLHISTRINVSILVDYLIKLMKLPVTYFDSKQTGDILQRMNDHKRIETFLTGSTMTVLFSVVSLVVFSFVLAWYNGTVFLTFVLASIMYTLWILIFLKRRKGLDYKKFEVAAKEQGARIHMVQGMQEIKLLGCGKQVRWSWERLQARLFKLNVKSLALQQWQQSGALFINEGKNILITFFCAKAAIDGQMTLGTMLAVQFIIGQLNSPIEQMISFIQSWQDARISMDRLNEVHYLEEEEPSTKSFLKRIPTTFARQLVGGKYRATTYPDNVPYGVPPVSDRSAMAAEYTPEPASLVPDITFEKVSFTYSGAGNSPVLKNISMVVPGGKTTAIVGVSGSGKTTLLKLLLKFYTPQKGELRLGETPLNLLSHSAWRAHCGVVMQDSYIFSDTIAGNIAVGAEKVNQDRLHYAAHMANLEDFISRLPLGFDTKIGPEGLGISMGQRQRILIARAIYRDPDYIFLDEATNSLDAMNERVIIGNLERFFQGRTVVVVAHRLSTVKHADQIILLHKGKIAERGTHQELVNLKGKYYTLVKNQLELGD